MPGAHHAGNEPTRGFGARLPHAGVGQSLRPDRNHQQSQHASGQPPSGEGKIEQSGQNEPSMGQEFNSGLIEHFEVYTVP